MLLWNCDSLGNKFHLLETLVLDHSPTIVALTETHIDLTIDNSEFIPGYTIVRKDRDRRGGGVLLAVLDAAGLKMHNTYCGMVNSLQYHFLSQAEHFYT